MLNHTIILKCVSKCLWSVQKKLKKNKSQRVSPSLKLYFWVGSTIDSEERMLEKNYNGPQWVWLWFPCPGGAMQNLSFSTHCESQTLSQPNSPLPMPTSAYCIQMRLPSAKPSGKKHGMAVTATCHLRHWPWHRCSGYKHLQFSFHPLFIVSLSTQWGISLLNPCGAPRRIPVTRGDPGTSARTTGFLHWCPFCTQPRQGWLLPPV